MSYDTEELKAAAEGLALLERAKNINTVDDLIGLIRDGANAAHKLLAADPTFQEIVAAVAEYKQQENANA